MTIQKLYVFACKNDLLEADINTVINKFNTSSISNNIQKSDYSVPLDLNKVYYTYEDVVELFSN